LDGGFFTVDVEEDFFATGLLVVVFFADDTVVFATGFFVGVEDLTPDFFIGFFAVDETPVFFFASFFGVATTLGLGGGTMTVTEDSSSSDEMGSTATTR